MSSIEVSQYNDFMSRFMSTHQVSKDAIAHFTSIPYLKPHLTSPHYKPIPTFSRVLKKSGEDFFFARTVSTPQTIPHLISMMLNDFKSPPETPPGQKLTPFKTSPKDIVPVPETPDCIFLLSLGSPGLDGHPSVIHGGMACAILDEMMGLCVMLHHQVIVGPRDSLFTVSLNVTYKAPVPTPSDVLVRCWLVARQGRKWYSIGQIVDREGRVLTEGEGIWVIKKREAVL